MRLFLLVYEKNLSLLVLIVTASLFGAPAGSAQVSLHTPLKGIEVRLQSLAVTGKAGTLDSSSSKSVPFELQTTTDEDGEFMFGYVPPGSYALGCSYTSCYTAFRKTKRSGITAPSEGDTISYEEPLLQISVDACEGMVCRVAVRKITPDDWSSDSQPSTMTTITKDWSNSIAWLNSGGGITLRIDGANSVISGKIEAQ